MFPGYGLSLLISAYQNYVEESQLQGLVNNVKFKIDYEIIISLRKLDLKI